MGGSVYDERPWLARYAEGQPADIAPDHPSALAMFDATVRRAPDAVAIHYRDSALTFAELDERSGAFAAALAQRGVVRGDRVALYLQNVPEFVVAVLAAWKLGAIAVSVNPMLKEREVRTLLEDCEPVALVTLESLWEDVAREAVAGHLGARRATETQVGELARDHAGQAPPDPGLGPDDVAFLTYTSGTTGPPKGAMNTHGNVVFSSQTYRDWVGVGGDDVILGVAPLFHITGLIAHIGLALLTGAPLVLDYRFDAAGALELIERHRVTFTTGAITVFIALMDAPEARRARHLVAAHDRQRRGADRARDRRGLRGALRHLHPQHLRADGDDLAVALRADGDARARSTPPRARCRSACRSTARSCAWSARTAASCRRARSARSSPRARRSCPGYWGRPEESERAIPGGALHTGDVGFMDADGWFYLVDRKKDLINAAGYKVWPREVEDVLYAHPAVREAAVVGVPDAYRGETVKAFVSLRPGERVDPDELIAFCRERMAAYKYPRVVELVDELPETASGKVLRRVLRDR